MNTELKFEDTLVCHKCDYLDKQKKVPKLVMPIEIWMQWEAATRVYPQLEILALFHVDAERVVTELHFPPQEIESGSCTLKEQSGHWEGMIHSHHSMGAFFSTMDKDTVLPNYQFSIVTNHAGKSDAVERIELPCGGCGFKELQVELGAGPSQVGLVEMVKAACELPSARSTKYLPGTGVGSSYLTHPAVCTCIMCVERKKGNGNVTPDKGGGRNGDTPFSKGGTTIITADGDGRGNGNGNRRYAADGHTSKRKLKRRQKVEDRLVRSGGDGSGRTPLPDTPRVLHCQGDGCPQVIFTAVDDWGTDERGAPLCKRCWHMEYGYAYS